VSDSSRWAAVVAALPTAARAERERPFWKALAVSWGWRKVADAGCGAGFYVHLLREIGVEAVGFDAALGAVRARGEARLVVADVANPPLRGGAFDAALCVGNTLSLLPSRAAQRGALGALARVVRPGGVVLLQGEDAGELVTGGAVIRTRKLNDGALHVRVFERSGRRVRMLAGVVRDGANSALETTILLPTSSAVLARMARDLGFESVALPLAPPGGDAAWWFALSVPSPGS
jgi:SAM-dependent methyltransferase